MSQKQSCREIKAQIHKHSWDAGGILGQINSGKKLGGRLTEVVRN